SLPELSFNLTASPECDYASPAMEPSGTLKVGVGVVEPVLAYRAEKIQLEGVVERLGLMLYPRGNVDHFAFADGDLLAPDQELERTLEHVGHLLALVRVHRHERALFQVDL